METLTACNPDRIVEALSVLVVRGSTVELRIPQTEYGTVSGYFIDLHTLAEQAAEWSGNAPAVYFTLNPVNPALLARAVHRVIEYAKQTTRDHDILCRRWLPIDLDPVRPPGISSTDAEHQLALERAEAIQHWLRGQGWPDPISADSGNGAHLLYRIDLPNDEGSRVLIQRCLDALGLYFTDQQVTLDQTTSNASRIWKLYGTLAAKGDPTLERPHRVAHLLTVPDPGHVVDRARLEALAALAPQPLPGVAKDFDLDAWLIRYGLPVAMTAPWQGGRKWILNPCPWNPAHTNEAAYVVQFPNGAVAAGCHHNSCRDKDWAALRHLVEHSHVDERSVPPGCPDGSTADEAPDELWTDLGNARRLVAEHGADLRYCSPWQCWLVWDQTRWVKDETGEVKRRAKHTARRLYAVAGQQAHTATRTALGRHALKSESKSALSAMIELAKSEAGIPISASDFDRDPWLLNAVNGTIDLRTGSLQPHRREQYLTKRISVPFQHEAQCPIWEQFLERIMRGDRTLIQFVQKAIGYALTGETSEHALFVLYGTGANGKTTLINTIKALLGDYARQTPTETLLVKRSDALTNDVARLHGARFVAAVEAEHGRRLAEGLIKQLTGGDTLVARFLHQEFFEFRPTFKVFLAVNHKPTIRGTDHGIWRRIKLIPFEVTIPPHEQDKRLQEKLLAELPGILNWALQGCLLWQREGLGEVQAVVEATARYRNEMDVLATFLGDCCEMVPNTEAPKPEFYKRYTEWCQENGERPMNQRDLHAAMIERGFKDDRDKWKRYWCGLRVVTDDTE